MVIIRLGWVIFVCGEFVVRFEKLNDLFVFDKLWWYCVLIKFSDYFINRLLCKIVIFFLDVFYDFMYFGKLFLNYLLIF